MCASTITQLGLPEPSTCKRVCFCVCVCVCVHLSLCNCIIYACVHLHVCINGHTVELEQAQTLIAYTCGYYTFLCMIMYVY